MVIPAALLVVCSLAIAVAAGPLFSLSQRTAADLLHPSRYVSEVLDR
jgi:formate hydrogenlyase subunit 3/multisubunit Na+/H+ antiporter MnhD subunit